MFDTNTSTNQSRTNPALTDVGNTSLANAEVMPNYTQTLTKSKAEIRAKAGASVRTAKTVFMLKIKNPANFQDQELGTFFMEVKRNKYGRLIDPIRKVENKAQRTNLKEKLPAIAFGEYTGAPSNNTYVSGSSMFVIADLDNIGYANLQAYKDILSSHPSVVACFVSPSGNGLKAFVLVPPIRDNAHSHKLWEQVNDGFLKLIPNHSLDPSGKDVSRRCYVSSDPNIHTNLQAKVLIEAFEPELEQEDAVAVFSDPTADLSKALSTDLAIANDDDVEFLSSIDTEDQIIAKLQGMCKAGTATENRHGLRLKMGRLMGGCIAGGLITEDKGRDIVTQLSDTIADNGLTSDKELKTLNEAILKGMDSPIYTLESKPRRNNEDADLKLIQENYSLYEIGGSFGVIDGRQFSSLQNDPTAAAKPLSFYKKTEGSLLVSRFAKKHDLDYEYQVFLTHPNTHVFTDIAFSPSPQPATTINLWRGPTAVALSGDATIFISFIREVICDNDESSYEYLMSYLAHMIQKPEEKAGVCIVMLGGQGIGKGTFFELLQQIWGASTYMANDVDQILGRFNAILERNYVVCMDEALFKGDAKSIEKFKNLITAPSIPIEQKNEPLRQVDSYHRFFAATNNEVFGKTDFDDRRLLHLKVSEKYKEDDTYFGPLHDAVKDDSLVGAFVYELLHRDISKFNPRKKPTTKESTNQKKHSLKDFDKFWHEVLKVGSFELRKHYEGPHGSSLDSGGSGDIEFRDGAFITTADLKTLYLRFDKNAERHSPVSTDMIGKRIALLCPSAKKRSRRPDGSTTLKKGRLLPSLTIARADLSKHLNVNDMDWEEDAEEELEEGLEDMWS